ncbi:methyltransferase domain-containing protein [bacterium]|nr:methyltransferase domain-containing protein [bacterium]
MRRCPVCQSYPTSVSHFHEIAYLHCKMCGLVYRETPEDPQERERYYRDLNPAAAVEVSKQELYGAVLDKAEQLMNATGRKGTGYTLLDVGAGTGSFMRFASRQGWDVCGVDPVPDQTEQPAGTDLSIHSGTLPDLSSTFSEFDLITYWDVMMYIDDPVHEMNLAFQRLRKGGLIYLRVRNHPVIRAMEKVWAATKFLHGWSNPAVYHPYNYSPGSMRTLATYIGAHHDLNNGRLTRGDAYGVGRGGRAIDTAKRLVERFTDGLHILSAGTWIVSPTLDVWLWKEN